MLWRVPDLAFPHRNSPTHLTGVPVCAWRAVGIALVGYRLAGDRGQRRQQQLGICAEELRHDVLTQRSELLDEPAFDVGTALDVRVVGREAVAARQGPVALGIGSDRLEVVERSHSEIGR